MQTIKELYDYIDELRKRPGTYTQDEIFEIGMLHKSLPQKEKNWASLSAYLNYNGTGEQLRQFVLYRQRKVNEVKKIVEESSSSSSEDVVKDTSSYEDDYKNKTKLRELLNEYNGHLRKEAKLESFLELLKESIEPFAKAQITKKINKDDVCKDVPESEAVLPFADLHLGNDTHNYRNTFTLDTARARVNQICNDTITYCKQNNVKTLHFLNLGDLISGLIHESLRYTQKLNVVNQLMKAVEIVAEMLYDLGANIPEVIYRSVTDNHSRMNANLSQSIDAENLNLLFTEFLKLKLANMSNIKFCENDIDISIGRFYLKNGKCIVYAHGDKEKKVSVVQDTMGLIREFPDYIFLAHYHNAAEHTFQGAKVFVTGSICGTDNYAFSHRLFGDAEQKLVIFRDRNILNISIMLN